MTINPDFFYLHNITDACAVWNILSSKLFYSRVKDCGVKFYCTGFVLYECLHKPRKTLSDPEIKLMNHLQDAIKSNDFKEVPLSLDDLQEVFVLEQRQRLGKGELSSIVCAMKLGQAFLTDDQGARRLALQGSRCQYVQTTPHLLSWLVFKSYVNDEEIKQISEDNTNSNRPLAPHFERACEIARNAQHKTYSHQP